MNDPTEATQATVGEGLIAQQNAPVVADSALAPEVFVDGYLSYTTTLSGMAKLTFFSQQHNVETNRQELRVVLRLAMPIVVAGALQQSLAANLAQTEASMGDARAN